MHINETYNDFKKDLWETVPTIFEGTKQKNLYLQEVFYATFWDFYLYTIPRKIFYYKEFVNYVGIFISNAEIELNKYITEAFKSIYSVRNAVLPFQYPSFAYLQTSLLRTDISSTCTKDNVIYCTHSPFLLFFLLRHWQKLPLPSNPEWFSMREGLIPFCENLHNYYTKALSINTVATDFLSNQIFGIDLFVLLLKNLSVITTNDEDKNKGIASIVQLLKFLPSFELQKLFFNKFKEGLSLAINAQENLYDFLFNFGLTTLLFFYNNNMNHKIILSHALTSNIESGTSSSKPEIKELPLSISYKALSELSVTFMDKINVKDINTRCMDTINFLKEKMKKNRRPTTEEKLFFKYYWTCAHPYYKIMNNENISIEEYRIRSSTYLEFMLKI